jgi:hypothetical protein
MPDGPHNGTSLQPGMDGPGEDHRAIVDHNHDPSGRAIRAAFQGLFNRAP